MPVIPTIVAGLAGTSIMTLLMTVIHRKGWADADMLRVLGSLLTRKLEGAVGAGLIIHLVAGVLFAFPYAILLTMLGSGSGLVGVAAVIGLLHGIIVGLLLVAFVSRQHPVPRFRRAGCEVAAAYVAGHVGYGLGVGVVLAALHVDWSGVV